MAILTPRELKDSAADNLVNTAAETHYTVPPNTRALISKAVLKNNDASAAIPITIAIDAVGDSGTIWAETLSAGEERSIDSLVGMSLNAGKLIIKQATTTADKVNIYIFGTPFPA